MTDKMTTTDRNDVKELLDTTKNYERLSFLKGVAGLYYRTAIAFTLGLFGLLILEGLNQGGIFYDKGLFGQATQFTITQIGLVVVLIGFLGDIAFAFTRFITDQRYIEYLSQQDRSKIVRRFSFGSLIGGGVIALPTIILATFDLIGQAQAWAATGLFIGILFLLLARNSGHWPSYIFGGMLTFGSIMIAFETIPGPYWMIIMMIVIAAGYITAISSYLHAQLQF